MFFSGVKILPLSLGRTMFPPPPELLPGVLTLLVLLLVLPPPSVDSVGKNNPTFIIEITS